MTKGSVKPRCVAVMLHGMLLPDKEQAECYSLLLFDQLRDDPDDVVLDDVLEPSDIGVGPADSIQDGGPQGNPPE